MSVKRKLFTTGGTVACALGIGYFMQQGHDAQRPLIAPLPAGVQQTVLAPHGVSDVDDFAMLQVESISLTSAQPDVLPPSQLAKPSLNYTSTNSNAAYPQAPLDPDTPKLGCEVKATAAPSAMAMTNLVVNAPCFGNQQVTIHHSGLMFTDVTNDDGALTVAIPALSQSAVFIVAFDNGEGAVASASMADLRKFDRVAVQWSGKTDFQIHAREFGASYGEQGHVWSGSSIVTGTQGGFVVRLGDSNAESPQLAEIYTYPTEGSAKKGTVRLSIEAEVTTTNCGRDISAQSLELRKDNKLRTRDLTLSVPDCGAAGDFMVLNNLVEDLKIAAR